MFVFVIVEEYISEDSFMTELETEESETIDVWTSEFCCIDEFETFAFCICESVILELSIVEEPFTTEFDRFESSIRESCTVEVFMVDDSFIVAFFIVES
jgi:hypothetical protein